MPYIGNTVQNQGFTPAIDYFNGNGVTVTFTLSRPIASVAQVIVAVDNVIQNPSSAFGVVGNSITFTSAPLAGTNNIWVEYTSLITTYQGISQDPTVIGDIRATGGYLAEGDFGNSFIDGNLIDYVTGRGRITVGELDDIVFYHGGTGARSEMMDLYYAGGAKIYGTTALTIPVGTTGERPGTPANGMTRYNSTLGQFEVYQNGVWSQYAVSYSIEYLVVAGGGGGGRNDTQQAGGGGAGGYLSGSSSVFQSTAYPITVGAGGNGATSQANGSNGSNSVFSSLTSIGGGGGGGLNGNAGTGAQSGGSGGGGTGGTSNYTGASGTSGQGNAGGNGGANGWERGGGGGGASAAGASGFPGTGNGGNGSTWSDGSTYAGGGGGGVRSDSTAGSGGTGGGGNGSNSNTTAASGTTNTGGGGGGGGRTFGAGSGGNGGNGGSGVVIIRYLGATRGSGGTITSSGGYTYHTFTSSGTYTA
jgi:hypothetical protein